MPEILEIAMLVCFGLSWPMNVVKSYRARTTKGKSLLFLCFIIVGYICGICAKLLSTSYKWYVLFFYVLNMLMVTADLALFFRNYYIEKKQNREEQK